MLQEHELFRTMAVMLADAGGVNVEPCFGALTYDNELILAAASSAPGEAPEPSATLGSSVSNAVPSGGSPALPVAGKRVIKSRFCCPRHLVGEEGGKSRTTTPVLFAVRYWTWRSLRMRVVNEMSLTGRAKHCPGAELRRAAGLRLACSAQHGTGAVLRGAAYPRRLCTGMMVTLAILALLR